MTPLRSLPQWTFAYRTGTTVVTGCPRYSSPLVPHTYLPTLLIAGRRRSIYIAEQLFRFWLVIVNTYVIICWFLYQLDVVAFPCPTTTPA